MKELIQNANDAGASQLDIGWVAGLPTAPHPLLRGPALFVLNNGTFELKHARAIRLLGLSNRAGEKATIGKFGLGLKSVFHLCEAFFYLASPNSSPDPETQPATRHCILNPWSGNDDDLSLHREWDTFDSESAAAMAHCLEPVLPTPRWFCLWLPLRMRAHCEGYDAIVDNYPGETGRLPETIFPGNESTLIANLLPMLRNLVSVRGWVQEATDQSFRPLFRVEVDGASQRTSFGADDIMPVGRRWLTGHVLVSRPTATGAMQSHPLPYVGLETHLQNPLFLELRNHDKWPKYNTLGQTRAVADKPEPHGAAYFSAYQAEPGAASLTINDAVFLPVGEPVARLPLRGARDIWLTLHGYFFVDSGRSKIVAPDAGSVEADWNRELAVRGASPLILPALQRFVADEKLTDADVWALTEALQVSSVLAERRRDICRHQQWVCCLTPTGREWRLLEANEPLLAVPAPPSTVPERAYEVFPALRSLCTARSITAPVPQWPRLAQTDDTRVWSC